MTEAISKVVRMRRQMFNEIGHEPTPEELGKKLGMPIEKVRKVLQIVKEPLSLEMPIGDEEDLCPATIYHAAAGRSCFSVFPAACRLPCKPAYALASSAPKRKI
jgi:DNA-directed RNA polymerase sigma subunit (sigma70/sigma32)